MRIIFANRLRGIAALCVIISHIFGVYFFNTKAVANLLNIPDYKIIPPLIVTIINSISQFNYGAFGVALFFLISGFVIPFSMDRYSKSQFLIARIFRLLPTYAAGLTLSLTALLITSNYYQTHFIYNLKDIVTNLCFVNGVFNLPSIDGLNWTLQIEVKFYFMVALLPFILENGIFILILVILFSLFNYLTFNSNLLINLQFSSVYLTFMLLGCLFNSHIKSTLTNKQLVLFIVILFSCFCFQVFANPTTATIKTVYLINYSIALIVFMLCYFLRDLFKEKNYIVDRLSDISYPLYACHSIVAYGFMRIATNYISNMTVVIITCLCIIFSLATIIHKLVELPTQKLGKVIATKYF